MRSSSSKEFNRIAILLVVVFLTSFNGFGAIKYVRAGATGDGSSISSPSGDIRLVVSNASYYDEIRVAQGNYTITSFIIVKNGVKIYGGYSSNFSQRSISSFVTVIQGNNNIRLLKTEIAAKDITIDGITFQNGAGTTGGAIYIEPNGIVLISSCRFIANNVSQSGGAVTVYRAKARFINCIFENNTALLAGGAVYERGSDCDYTGCTFINNTAASGGGVARLGSTYASFYDNCFFTGNKATGTGSIQYYGFCNAFFNEEGGGAVHFYCDFLQECPVNFAVAPEAIFKNCRFYENEAHNGAAMFVGGAAPLIQIDAGSFRGNIAKSNGVIRTNTASGIFLIQNSEVTGNFAVGNSPSILVSRLGFHLINTTITKNRLEAHKGFPIVIGSALRALKIQNSIIYDNNGHIFDLIYDSASNKNNIISSKIIGLSIPQISIDAAEPKFENPMSLAAAPTIEGNYALLPCSPAVNAGNNTYLSSSITTDILGLQRKWNNGVVDIGAYELQGTPNSNDAFYYVDSSINIRLANQDGKSWATAFKYLGHAILFANFSSCTQAIYVAKGTYYPDDGAPTSRDVSFYVGMGSYSIIGGYPSGGGARNLAANPTILSGNIGNKSINTDNAFHVMKVIIEDRFEPFVLDGLTIQDGNADQNSFHQSGTLSIPRHSGAGIYADSSNFIIKNCLLKNNTALIEGGAIYLEKGSLELQDCLLEKNAANMGGALVVTEAASLDLVNTSLNKNKAQQDGGGILVKNFSRMNAVKCVFDSNYSVTTDGGAIRQSSQSSVSLSNNHFKNNIAKYGGAVRTLIGDSLNFYADGNFFTTNIARENGGGALSLISGIKGKNMLINNVFSKNITNTGTDNQTSGGASLVQEGGAETFIVNNTFYGDSAKSAVGIGALHFKSGGSNRNVFNNIFYRNFPVLDGSDWSIEPGTVLHNSGSNSFSTTNPKFYSEGDIDGTDNILGTADDGLQLANCAALINAGDQAIINSTENTFDILSDMRSQLGRVDVGAYEKQTINNNSAGFSGITHLTDTSTAIQASSDTTFYARSCNKLIAGIIGDGSNNTISGVTKVLVNILPVQPTFYVKRSYYIQPENSSALLTGKIILYFTQEEFDAFNAVSTNKLPTHPGDEAGKTRIRIQQKNLRYVEGVAAVEDYFTLIVPTVSWSVARQCWQLIFETKGFGEFKVGTDNMAKKCSGEGNILHLITNASDSSFQWQVNEGSGYQNLVENSNYSGVNTADLRLTVPNSFAGHRYRCIINNVPSPEIELRIVKYWTGNGFNNSNWLLAQNWGPCEAIPDEYTDVVIPAGRAFYPQLQANTSIRSLTIESGASVIIQNNRQLTIIK